MIHQEHPAPADQLTYTFDDRHWRVRGLEKQLSCERLRVNLLVERRELVHVDTLDLYAARSRRAFLAEAAAELYVEEATLKADLGQVFMDLELRQQALVHARVARQRPPETPVMTEPERAAALELLTDPHLLERITADYATCGLVGEETNLLVCYLAGVSRLLPQPLAVLVQSSSAAGKTALVEATLQFLPPEAQLRWSALTSQALYYLDRDELRHKILAVAEEEGARDASYALKLLQSEGRLSLAVATKARDTGRGRTEHYTVEGPVALLLTTTREEPDSELANRCLVLSVNEDAQQTAAIHARQRAAYTRDGLPDDAQAIRTTHQHAQRLLEPRAVVIPWAEQLTFRTDQTRYRRDHAKYLSLIAAVTLLHQYQRAETERVRDGQAQRCVVATLEDVAVAQRLASAALAPRGAELLPQTRLLRAQLGAYVTARSAQEQVPCSALRFTQRELRTALGWQDRALRRQLARLVELEYLVVHRTGCGNQKVYQWWPDDAADPAEAAAPWGLVDVAHLARRAPR
jgi:DNA primase